MKAAKVDANQAEIVRVLRDCGVSVQSLHDVGKGVPDLLCGYRGQNFLLEIKDGSKVPSARLLTPQQQDWHEAWRGQKAIAETPEQALRVLGLA